MKWIRRGAFTVLLLVILGAFFAPVIAPYTYERQFRESPDALPSRRFLMGTDELGRDRFSRLIYATRTSAVLAPCAAAVSIALALAISLAGPARVVSGLTSISLSLPWLFLFIILRAALPLNTSPGMSVVLTFGLMGVAGWAWPARIFGASLAEMAQSGWMLQAKAAGFSPVRAAMIHQWPHLRAAALAQFRILIPAYILSEASLGLLGLGVTDPVPSWGTMLQELQHPWLIAANPMILIPLALLVTVMICLEVV